MDIGSGIGIAGITFSAAAVAITVVKTRAATKDNVTNKTNSGVYLECVKHSGFEEILRSLEKGQDEIKESIARIFHRLDDMGGKDITRG